MGLKGFVYATGSGTYYRKHEEGQEDYRVILSDFSCLHADMQDDAPREDWMLPSECPACAREAVDAILDITTLPELLAFCREYGVPVRE